MLQYLKASGVASILCGILLFLSVTPLRDTNIRKFLHLIEEKEREADMLRCSSVVASLTIVLSENLTDQQILFSYSSFLDELSV